MKHGGTLVPRKSAFVAAAKSAKRQRDGLQRGSDVLFGEEKGEVAKEDEDVEPREASSESSRPGLQQPRPPATRRRAEEGRRPPEGASRRSRAARYHTRTNGGVRQRCRFCGCKQDVGRMSRIVRMVRMSRCSGWRPDVPDVVRMLSRCSCCPGYLTSCPPYVPRTSRAAETATVRRLQFLPSPLALFPHRIWNLPGQQACIGSIYRGAPPTETAITYHH